MWFTMGETRRANWERAQAARERERSEQAESTLAATLVRMEQLAAELSDLRRLLDERTNGNEAA